MAEIGWANPYEYDWSILDSFDFSGWDWVVDANCRNMDTEAFFQTDKRSQRDLLMAVCNACPVIDTCREHAVTHDERGWWGGTTREDRRRIVATREREALFAKLHASAADE